RVGRLETVQSLCKSLTSYLLFFVFGILLLKAIGLDMMPFITTAGVLGLAVGFGSQKLVKDVISGFFIFIDNLFVIGETVTVNGITGQVHEMGTRVTRLLDSSGRLYLIPNGDIGTVTNLSRYPVGDFVEFSVAASADLGKVINTVNSVGNALFEAQDTRLQAAPQFIGTTSFTAASITVRVSVVSDPVDLAKEQMRVREELRKALTSAGIALV
ncbi:MAG TPA: mechanosensitive ion channel domain-containing protein, partial [Chthonomonadales bacterium]|nr:mechanosensitive ion channel domain-containing protein [Chthonomonadales bacterium]